MIYDVHAHCVPQPLLDELRSRPQTLGAQIEETDRGVVVDLGGFRTLPIGDDLVDRERRLLHMDRQRVDVQVLSPFVDLLGWELDVEIARSWCRLYNEHLAAETENNPNRLRAIGTVPIQDGQSAAEELKHAVTNLGMLGVELGSRAPERELDDPDLQPFWQLASELECLILLHPRDPLGALPIDDYMLRHLVGRPAETTLAAGRILLSGMLERYPGTRIVVVHGGGFLPYQIGRLRKGFQRPGSGIATTVEPKTALRSLYFDTILNDATALSALIEMVGPDRVVLGTDYPYALGDEDPVTSVESVSALDDVSRQLILGGNLERLMGAMGL